MMKFAEFGSLQMTRTEQQHFGTGKIQPLTYKQPGIGAVSGVKGVNSHTQAPAVTSAVHGKSFQDYLMEAVNTVNSQQLDVTNIQEKLVTSPDEVDVHDVTIAMSKARMSLNLAQTVIDRLVSGWNEITTTR